MLTLVTILVGVLAGFGGARILRRPATSASIGSSASSVGRSASSAGRSLGGAVGARRDLDLPHLQRSTLSEMLRHVRPERGATAVPAEFRVRLHPDDKATVDQAPGFFRQGLEQALAQAAADHAWDVPSRIRIDIEADPTRRPGSPAVDARGVVTPAPAPTPAPAAAPAAPVAPAAARLTRGDGPDVELGDVTTIGRGEDRDIRVDDARISRRHAVVRRDGEHWTITDEGSSNGTRRNGHRLTPTTPVRLSDGDQLGVGPVTLTFRTGS